MQDLLTGWRGATLDDLLARVTDAIDDPEFPTVRAWRERGGRVLGHFQVYFPEELAHAAGLLPVKVRGARLEARQAESRFGSYLCSILKTSLELALTNRLQLDMFVTHPICDAARNLCGVWGRSVTYPCQILYLPQNANSGYSARYLRGEYLRLLKEIEQVAAYPVTETDLRRSIGVFNVNRRLLDRLATIRRDTPWLVAVHEAYALVAAGGLIPKEEHNALLAYALSLIEKRDAQPQDRIRVVFEGGFCEQPPLDLLRALGQMCYVVDDDLLVGMRWIRGDVDPGGDPLHNLATAYLDQSTYSPVQHDLHKPKEEMLVQRMKDARAEAAVIAAAKMCEPGLDEQVAYAKALDAEGRAYFITEFEERMTGFENLQIQLETFVENVLFA